MRNPILVLALLVGACGGPPPAARTALERLGHGVNVADEAIADKIRERGPEAREQVLREVAAGAITDVEAGMLRFEELMRPTTIARNSVRLVRTSAFAVETALDVWANGGVDFMREAACLLGHLLQLVRDIETIGVDVPEEFTTAIETLSVITTLACPEARDVRIGE